MMHYHTKLLRSRQKPSDRVRILQRIINVQNNPPAGPSSSAYKATAESEKALDDIAVEVGISDLRVHQIIKRCH
jgi:hypothetical protein